MRLAALLIALSLPHAALADDWALEGFDPVEYAAEGEAVPGRPEIVTNWNGRDWHFSKESNRDEFESNPRAYTPGFDGYCPVSLAEGRPVHGDPKRFVIVGERLYLLHDEAARARLLSDPKRVLMKAKAAFAQMKP